MEGEIQQPVLAPEPIPEQEQLPPEQVAQQPDLVIAPANPIDSEALPGVQDRLAQFKENPEIIPAARPSIAELEGKLYDPLPDYLLTREAEEWRKKNFSEDSWMNKRWSTEGKDFTKEEAFYLEHGWKAYLQKFGDQGYTLQEIVSHEKLDAGDIENAIADGTIKDPNALRLYGQMQLDYTTQYFTRWALNHVDEEWVQDRAKQIIADTKAECEPLIHGTTQDLLNYSNNKAANHAAAAAYTPADNEQKLTWQEEAVNWYTMTAQLAEQRLKEENTVHTRMTENAAQITLNKAKADLETMTTRLKKKQAEEGSSQTSGVPNQTEAPSSEQPEEQKEKAEEPSTAKEQENTDASAPPEQQQFQELQNQLDQLKTQHEKVLAENTALRHALTQATAELEEVREAIEGDEAIDPKKKEHWLIRITKAIGALVAITVVGTTNTVEDNLEK